MSKIRVFINRKKVFADPGKTILEVVHEHDIDHIPNLCYEQQLKPYNSCFLCLVEVKGVNKLVPACSTVIREDMEITTRSSKITDGRRASLELLLSNHFADCLPPCSMRCPAGVDVQGYIAHIANGDYQEAVRVIKETNPLPAICGRVCTRPCELACRRNILDKNVKIDFLKRFASDVDMFEALRHVKPRVAPDKDKSIAVIGAGPAGLSAAYYLRLSGYHVTIFEGMPAPGGMLRYGIPEYRLPYDVLDREIDTILELGVTLKTNAMLGEDMTIRNLFDDGFDAVFLGIGAWGSRSLGVKGQDAEGVLSGIKFLEELGRGKKPDLYGNVVVVGGGNTAVDCARTSLRLNADKVTLLYRRTRKEMPANEIEIDAAEHEGVDMHFLAAPVEVITENNRVKALKCIKMELGAPDASGRRRPVPISGSEFTVEADFAFAAIGQNPMGDVFQTDDPEFLPENGRIKMTRWESVIVNPDTYETDTDGVFAGGDMVTGAATVIEAIAAGRKAAHAIHTFFTDGESRGETVHFNSRKDDYTEVECKHLRYSQNLEAHEMPELAPEERIQSFDEVELGYTEATAREESTRCLECGCDAVFVCKLREYATEYGVEFGKFKGEFSEHELDRSHPFIELDQNKCILCGRCIRVCSEIAGESVYGFHTRGFHTCVTPEMGKPLAETSCISCGLCVETCPTGAIVDRIDWEKPGPWKLHETLSACGYCGVGCSLTFHTHSNKVIKTGAGDPEAPTHGNLCKKGRFGARYIHDENRLMTPLFNKESYDWPKAIAALSQSIKTITSKTSGDEIAVCVSPRITNEEAYLIQKFARIVLKTHNIFSIAREINPEHVYDDVESTASSRDIETADAILISGADLSENHPVAAFMVHHAVRNEGRLICVGSDEHKLAHRADVFLRVEPGTESLAIMGLMQLIIEHGNHTESLPKPFVSALKSLSMKEILDKTGLNDADLNRAAEILETARKPVVVSERDFAGVRDLNDLRILRDLTGVLRGHLALFTRFNNAQGILDMGAVPDRFGAYQPIDDADVLSAYQKTWSTDLNELKAPVGGFLKGLKAGQWKAVFIFGEDLPKDAIPGVADATALLKKVDFLMVADIFRTDTMAHADVALPMGTVAETSGSFTNGLRHLSTVNQAIEPVTGMETWEMIVGLARALKQRYKFDYLSMEDIRFEIQSLIPMYRDAWRSSTSDNQCRKLEPPCGSDDGVFDPDRLTTSPRVVEARSIENTNCIWTWFTEYWHKAGLN